MKTLFMAALVVAVYAGRGQRKETVDKWDDPEYEAAFSWTRPDEAVEKDS